MTTLKSIDLTCPNCGHQFRSEAVKSRNVLGRKHTDFHVQPDGVQPLSYGVHLCVRCGFAGLEERFSALSDVSYEVRRHVWDELTPRLSSGTATASEKYEFAARVAFWDGADPARVGDLWLRGAWCCVDEGDVEAERYYRRHAAWSFEEALQDYDGVAGDDRATMTYLVGELWRRIGDTARAAQWFDRVPSEIGYSKEQLWLAHWARQQRDDPAEWFA